MQRCNLGEMVDECLSAHAPSSLPIRRHFVKAHPSQGGRSVWCHTGLGRLSLSGSHWATFVTEGRMLTRGGNRYCVCMYRLLEGWHDGSVMNEILPVLPFDRSGSSLTAWPAWPGNPPRRETEGTGGRVRFQIVENLILPADLNLLGGSSPAGAFHPLPYFGGAKTNGSRCLQ